MTKTAFIGLGVMGGPMAGHLAKAGHQVTVYNRTSEKAENWVKEHGGESAPTPAQAAAMAGGADIVCACVGNDADLRSVVSGDHGLPSGLPAGATVARHPTPSATLSVRQMEREAASHTALGTDKLGVTGPVGTSLLACAIAFDISP